MSKKQHVTYRTDSFVDYAGNVRKFIICAISDVIEPVTINTKDPKCNCDDVDAMIFTSVIESTINANSAEVITDDVIADVAKCLSLGIAIQNSADEFNEEIGKKIAYGRADKKPYSRLFATTKGVINTPMVDAILKQECAYFKQVPYLESWGIRGYSEAAKKYYKKMKNGILPTDDKAFIAPFSNQI